MRGLEVTFVEHLSVGNSGVCPGKVQSPFEGIFRFSLLQSHDPERGMLVLREDYLVWRGMGKYKDILLFRSEAPNQPNLEIGEDMVVKIVDLETQEVIYQKPA